jgi:hemin uptake protein HemP
MTTPDKPGSREPQPKNITLERCHLPLTISYEGAKYVLVLTRSNKLLLQKPLA